LAQPGPEHERLAQQVGKWNYEFKMWMEPGGSPMVYSGTSESKMILDGRFLQNDGLTGAGTPMETKSVHIYGFDRRKQEYTLVGFDTWGTYWVTAAGKFDEKKNAIVMHGSDYDPIMGFTQEFDFVYQFKGPDTSVFEVIFTDSVMSKGTGAFKMVEVTSTRAK
jgi:hypothetical protein